MYIHIEQYSYVAEVVEDAGLRHGHVAKHLHADECVADQHQKQQENNVVKRPEARVHDAQ